MPATATVTASGTGNSIGTITGLKSGTVSITATDSANVTISKIINIVKPGISPAFLTNCVGLTNTFALTNSAGTGVVVWSQSGLLTGNTRTNHVAFTNAGPNVLTANYAGCLVSATVTVVAVSSLLPVMTNFCNSGTVVYTNQTTPASFSQYVNWGGEGLSGTGSSRTNIYSTTGPHIVSNWCGTSVKYSTTTVYRIDIAQTNANVLADATAPVTFYLTNSYGAATWQITPSPGGGAAFAGGNSGDTVTVNPGSVGTNYTITSSADAFSSCSDTATLQVVKVTFTTNLVAFCEGTTASVAMTVSPSNFLSSLTFDTVTNVAAGPSNSVASVNVASTTNLILNSVSPGTATLRVRLGASTFFGPVIEVVRVTFPTNVWYAGLGRSASFAVDVVPPDAPVAYASKDTGIITVSGSGTNITVNGIAFGTTKVQAIVGNSSCVEKDVTVANVIFSPTPLYICVSKSAQSTGTIVPSNAPVTYAIEDGTVASGSVIGNTVTITSLTNSLTHVLALVGNSVVGTLDVYGWRVEFESKPFGVATGHTLRLVATVLPSGLANKVSFATYGSSTAVVETVIISNAKPVITVLGITNGSAGLAAYIGTNSPCAIRTINVGSLGLQYAYFSGTNRIVVRRDDGSGAYEDSFHWSPTTNSPLAYVRNTYLSAAAQVAITPSAWADPIVVRGDAGIFKIPPSTNGAVGGIVTTGYRYSQKALPNSVNIINPLVINWQASLDGGESFVDVGSSSNLVYEVLGPPIQASSNYLRSVFDVGCRSAIGQTDPATVVSLIWSDFFGPSPGVFRADMTQMTYWGPFASAASNANICFSTQDLLRYADGKCGAWANFMDDTIKIHGIAGSLVSGITTKDIPGSGLHGFGFHVYTSIPGQGNASPRFDFYDHAIVKYGGVIYDPSYGVAYSSELNWEDSSLFRLIYTNSVGVASTNLDIKAIQETIFAP